MTRYKRKGIDFCSTPGCMSQEYGGEVDGLRYCLKHIDEAHEYDRAYCESIADEQAESSNV